MAANCQVDTIGMPSRARTIARDMRTKKKKKGLAIRSSPIECFHMTSRRPYWCPKTMKRRPCWCPKPVLWDLNSFLMQTLSFVPINLHRCWPREWKHSIQMNWTCAWTRSGFGLSIRPWTARNPSCGSTYLVPLLTPKSLNGHGKILYLTWTRGKDLSNHTRTRRYGAYTSVVVELIANAEE